MALSSTQSQREMSTRNLFWGVKAAGAYGWQTYHVHFPTVLKSGSLNPLGGPGSVVAIATGYGAGRSGDRIPMGARFSAPVQTGPRAHPASCTMGTGSFPGVKSGQGVTLTPHPLLVPWSWKGRAIPLLPLRAVRPVQSLSACTRVTFTFTFYKPLETSGRVQGLHYLLLTQL